jgi:hypothetical protein
VPAAAAVAERMLQALGQGKLVPPQIMSDRYVVYRVPEFLQAYLDYGTRPEALPSLPYQRQAFRKYFPGAGVYASVEMDYYTVANLAKGGVVKVFDLRDGRLVVNDCGVIGRLNDGRIVTSQWIDSAHSSDVTDDGWTVTGHLNVVPTHKVFTPVKSILFRSALLLLGWSPRLSHWLKGRIRGALMLGSRPIPVRFSRRFFWEDSRPALETEIQIEGKLSFSSVAVGDEFFVRYVPQSRYFQDQELGSNPVDVSEGSLLARLNRERSLGIRTLVGEDGGIRHTLEAAR